MQNLLDPQSHHRFGTTTSVGIGIMPWLSFGTICRAPQSSMVALKYRTGNVSLSTCHDGGVSNLFDPQTHPRNGAQMSVVLVLCLGCHRYYLWTLTKQHGRSEVSHRKRIALHPQILPYSTSGIQWKVSWCGSVGQMISSVLVPKTTSFKKWTT